MGVADLAVDLGTRNERGDGVDDDDVERVAANECLGHVERLLARVGLRDEQRIDVDAEVPRIERIERVLGVDEGRGAAGLLRVGHHVIAEGRLARRLGPVDLADAPARDAADAKRDIERDRARADAGHVGPRVVAEPHDGALPELLLDLLDRAVQRRRLLRRRVLGLRLCVLRLRVLRLRFRHLAASVLHCSLPDRHPNHNRNRP